MTVTEPLVEETGHDVALAPIRALNVRAHNTGVKIPWEERLEVVRRQFPSTRPGFDWAEALLDWRLMARIVHDVLKLEAATPGRAGPRAPLTETEATAAWNRLSGNDYATLPFDQAFQVLIHPSGRRLSVSHISHKTGLARVRCHRLLRGEIDPTIDDIVAIAEGFKKHPSYFVEYRTAFITARIAERLDDNPDVSIRLYQQVR